MLNLLVPGKENFLQSTTPNFTKTNFKWLISYIFSSFHGLQVREKMKR